MPRPNTKDAWTAYNRGNRDFYKGRPFSANPYKSPGSHIEWAQGWLEAKKRPKTGAINKRLRERYSAKR